MTVRRFLLAGGVVACACTLAAFAALPVGGADRVERRVMAMGTSLDLTVEASSRELALAASERAVRAMEAAEARLSTWRDDTELARLNRAPVGQPQPLSPALAADLAGAASCWRETGGAFDPAVGPLVRAWDLRGAGRVPTDAERRQAIADAGMDGLRLGPGAVAVRERAGLVLEEGGFGKGAGLGDALRALAASPGISRAALDLGGQVALFGGETWTVRVADPRQRDRAVIALTVAAGSVSTSGDSERGIVVGGRRYGHILDPRTGEPAADFGSVTVWTADPLEADCLSTGLFVLGPEAAFAWAAAHPGVEILVLRPAGQRLEARATPGLRGRIEPLVPGIAISYRGA